MGLREKFWTRKEYATWDDAFRGLTPAVRQQSVRVAAYTQVLFVQACAAKFGADNARGAERMRGQYAELAYKCGMYHQLGKALVPPEYQIWQDDFTEEEVVVYRKYTTDGRTLVASLQDRGMRARDKRRGEVSELPTENIPWLMLRESCEQHMERWNGTGWPTGCEGRAISPIAQIVGLAKELDRLSAEVPSETPFDDAYEQLMAQAGSEWSHELIAVLKSAKTKCRGVYNKYIHYTQTLPKTIPLVEKRKDRPLGLSFRPMTADEEGRVVAYEAVPWFGGIANRPGETEGMEELLDMFRRKEMVVDVSQYLLYEAADAALRVENCKLDLKIMLKMIPDFYLQGSQLQLLNQLFKDQPISRDRLLLTVPAELVLNANKGTMEILDRYLRNGISLVLDGYHPDKTTANKLRGMGFSYIRIAGEHNLRPETAELMRWMREIGFTLIGSGADTHEAVKWLPACGVAFMGGTLTGIAVSEDELIRDALARER